MKCGRFEHWIALESGGDLPPKDSARLAAHLADCPACREFAQAMEAARGEFRLLAAEPVEEADLAAVRRAVRERIAGQRSPGPRFMWLWVPVGAVAALVLAASLWFTPRTAEAPAKAPAATARSGQPRTEEPDPARAAEPNRPPTIGERQQQAAGAEQIRAARRPRAARQSERQPEREVPAQTAASAAVAVSPDVVRIQTPDPNVVVYWVLEDTEDAEDAGDE